jgi:hypothetical protein
VNAQEWLKLLGGGQFGPLCRQILAALDVVCASTYARPEATAQQSLDLITNLILFTFTQPYFIIPDEFADQFVARNHAISNLVANSHFRTTDAQLEVIRNQSSNFIKILTLYSARNRVEFDRKAIFAVNPYLASIWYMQYAELFHAGLVNPVVQENLRRHMENPPGNMVTVSNMQEPFFGASYTGSDAAERAVKRAVNETVQRVAGTMPGASLEGRNRRKVAVLSTYWRRHHSVYRNYSQFIAALRPKYHVTFIQLGRYSEQFTEGFDEVRVLESNRGIVDPKQILQNDFQAMVYPDIGMTSESVLLSNFRLAPVQMALLGHSVSTFGAEIDYFFSGANVEVAEEPERNYSERLVLLPEMGVIHNRPLYTRAAVRPKPGFAKDPERVLINCPWQSHKVNVEALRTLAAIRDRSKRPVCFRFFIGAGTNLYNDHPPFYYQMREALGAGNFELATDMSYEHYMYAMEQGHFSLDSWHFGGCNTVSDSLFIRVPIVCREGGRWYNRIGPHMLRLAGVPELVAGSEEAYVQTALRLIEEEGFRRSLGERLERTDLDQTIYRKNDLPHFVAAFDYLMEHHERLKAEGARTPLRFPRG